MGKPPGLTAILVSDSNTRAGETPSYHNQQRKVGVQVVWPCTMWLGELDLPEVLDFLAEFLVSSDVETPWLDGHPGARL